MFVVDREGSLPKSKILVQVVSDCIRHLSYLHCVLTTLSIRRQLEVTAMQTHLHCIAMHSDKCKVD